MNKTVTINLSGIIFHIEEDAYEKLSRYLQTIKGYFQSAEGSDEIISDIESRIAEILREKTNSIKQVVVMSDVDHVIDIMGKPEDFGVETESRQQQQNESQSSGSKRRRMFRDPDDKVLGGVCGGLGNYFDIDPLWIRMAWAISFFAFGFGFLFYLLLWIIIPEAKTTAEKLEMRGENPDINNISNFIKEEAKQFKDRAKNFGEQAGTAAKRGSHAADKVGDALRQIVFGLFNVVGRVFGGFLVFIGIIFFIALISLVFGFGTIDGIKSYEAFHYIFGESIPTFLLILGIILFIGVPVIMFIYKGIKMIFRIHYHNRWLNITMGILWGIGWVIAFYIGTKAVSEFSEEGKSKTPVVLQNAKCDTLFLRLSDDRLESSGDNDYGRIRKYARGKWTVRFNDRKKGWHFIEKNGQKLMGGFAYLTIIPSESDSFELNIIRYCNGPDRKTALDNARTISYKVAQDNSQIFFDNYFSIAPDQYWRAQEVKVQLKVPKGKVIMLDKSLYGFIFDVDNVTNTWDGDMVGRRWKMTAAGLECIDCEGLDIDEVEDAPVPPSPPGKPGAVKFSGEDAHVKIDENGINVHAKDAKVNITQDGIEIKTNKIDTKGEKGDKGEK